MKKTACLNLLGQAVFPLLNHPLDEFKSVRFTIVDFAQEIGYNIVKYPLDD